MFRWRARGKKSVGGWFATSLVADTLAYAHGRPESGGKTTISSYGSADLGADRNGLQKAARDLDLERYQCLTLLSPGEYQLFVVEAPNVPKEELKSAIRWRVKDLIDYHIDDASLDLLDIPRDAAESSRGHQMLAVCARNDVIQRRIEQFQQADIPLSVIDILETAQRNVASLFEEPDRGLALVYFGPDWGLLTINFRSELYLVRRLEIGVNGVCAPDEAGRKDAFERVSLELQRTFDHFERQFRHVAISKVMLGPLPEDRGLREFLASNVTLPVADLDLLSRMSFSGAPPDRPTQWRLFHNFGAALRREEKVL